MTEWLNSADIRPYVYMRKENLFSQPGRRDLTWFANEPIYKNPLVMADVGFADQILQLEGKAFAKADLKMPRWVFYDCAIMPGFVCGFAYKTERLPQAMRQALEPNEALEWTPISLFITIPSLQPGEWIAHNLCTANSLLGEKDQLYALGFLTKAFGLWYANVEVLCGMTQWLSPAIRLHSHYGHFEILTAYTPVHSYARTLTYRSRINLDYWPAFFKQGEIVQSEYEFTGYHIDPKDDESLKALQRRIEGGEGPFFFKTTEIRMQPLDISLKVYRLASLRAQA